MDKKRHLCIRLSVTVHLQKLADKEFLQIKTSDNYLPFL